MQYLDAVGAVYESGQAILFDEVVDRFVAVKRVTFDEGIQTAVVLDRPWHVCKTLAYKSCLPSYDVSSDSTWSCWAVGLGVNPV
jgi:hypothetical protein